jgi:hypothetical protein
MWDIIIRNREIAVANTTAAPEQRAAVEDKEQHEEIRKER